MKTSNKILFGVVAFMAASILSFVIAAKVNLLPPEKPSPEQASGDIDAVAQEVVGNGVMGTETRSADPIREVVVISGFDLELVDAPGQITIEAEENLLPHIETRVKEGTFTAFFGGDTEVQATRDVIIKVPVAGIRTIRIEEEGFVSSNSTLRADSLELYVNGPGDLTLPVEASSVLVELNDSGDATLSGTTGKLWIKKSGPGDLEAQNLEAQTVDIHSRASGDVNIRAVSELNIELNESSQIRYWGNPLVRKGEIRGGRLLKGEDN